MKTACFYRIEINEKVARAIMKQVGDTGDPKTLVIQAPTKNFSHESFDEFMYSGADKAFFPMIMSLIGTDGVTADDVRESRIYQVTRIGTREHKVLTPNQDFRDMVAIGM